MHDASLQGRGSQATQTAGKASQQPVGSGIARQPRTALGPGTRKNLGCGWDGDFRPFRNR